MTSYQNEPDRVGKGEVRVRMLSVRRRVVCPQASVDEYFSMNGDNLIHFHGWLVSWDKGAILLSLINEAAECIAK